MDPLTIGLIMGALDLGANMLSANKAKKEAKKAEKKNMQMAAIQNLISVAGGGGMTGMPQAQPTPSSFDPRMLTSALKTGASMYSMADAVRNDKYNKGLNQAKLGIAAGSTDQETLEAVARKANVDRALGVQDRELKRRLTESDIAKNLGTAEYYTGAGDSLKRDALNAKIAQDEKRNLLAEIKTATDTYSKTGDINAKNRAVELIKLLNKGDSRGDGTVGLPQPTGRAIIGNFESE